MSQNLEAEYKDFLQIQGLKGQIDIAKVTAEFGIEEEDLFEFVNQRVTRLEEEGPTAQNIGESVTTLFLFGYWLRGVREGS